MGFKNIRLSAVAASCIALSASTLSLSGFTAFSPARAETSISVDISVGSFHDQLQPYGSWVSYQNEDVWIPENVDES